MPFLLTHLRMAGVHFLLRRRDQRIEQIIGFYAEAFASGNLYRGTLLVFFRNVITQFHGATRCERHHFIRKVMVIFRLLGVAKTANRFNDIILRIGLAGIDDVIDCIYAAKVWMVGLAGLRRDPDLATIRVTIETLIAEV